MAFKKTKQEALDLLQEKEKRLAELTEESAYAVQMVQNTIDMLISAVHHENGEERLHLLMLDPHIPAGAKLY